ncbi:phospholipid-transporting ATPase VD-like [Elgaria multicarinata webbii]|uniref:phospholipid-transporting ATPase VD-like n=1 Tax=Elgaria multicarinata webbii TaxID=159646 RepID=UPI002FCCD406
MPELVCISEFFTALAICNTVVVSDPEQPRHKAVLASDFAISQFKQLSKLLFVHGHWCYTRLANMVLYFFYKNLPYVRSAFAGNIADAFYQSFVCFFIPYFTFLNSDIDIYSFGNVMNTSMFFIIMLHLVIESKTLNWIHWVVLAGSVLLFFMINGTFGATCILCNPPANQYWIMERQMSNPVVYLICFITVIVALLPRFMFRVIQSTVFPNPLVEARQLEGTALKGGKRLLHNPRVVPV